MAVQAFIRRIIIYQINFRRIARLKSMDITLE